MFFFKLGYWWEHKTDNESNTAWDFLSSVIDGIFLSFSILLATSRFNLLLRRRLLYVHDHSENVWT